MLASFHLHWLADAGMHAYSEISLMVFELDIVASHAQNSLLD